MKKHVWNEKVAFNLQPPPTSLLVHVVAKRLINTPQLYTVYVELEKGVSTHTFSVLCMFLVLHEIYDSIFIKS